MYKNSVTIAREHRILMNNLLKEGCIFFTGAGISVSPPSSIPMANQIKKAILDSLLSIVDEDYKNKESIKVCLESHFYEMKMETLFEVFIRNGVTNIFECLRIFVQSVPNLDHLTIALLCKLGFVKAVFTLNFDLLHEAALKTIGIPYRSYLKDEDYFGFEYKTENKHVPIFHLHNGFLPDNSGDLGHLNAATSNVRSYLPHQKGGVLKHYLSSNPIFCTGYSNNDIDTFRYIEKFGVKIIWYSHNVYENIPERVKNLMSLKKTDFLHIVRNEEVLIETCFSDVILNVLGGDKRDELKKLINTEGSLSLNEKINYIEKLIKPLIISSSNSLLIISDLLDILNERLLALDILSDKCWESNYPNNEKQILFYRSRILSHIYERLGYSRKALRYSYQSVNLSDNNLYFRTLLISTLLGILDYATSFL